MPKMVLPGCMDANGQGDDDNDDIKGQLISKPIYDLLTSPKERTD